MSLGHITTADEDFKFKKEEQEFIRLDIACGNNKKENFIGVDCSKDTQADIIADLEKYPWPFEGNTIGEIFSSHYIEHVTDLKSFMEEIYRILIPGGSVNFVAPYYSSVRAMQDFTHKRFISENTFLYFVKNWLNANGLQHYDIKCNFVIESVKYIWANEWKNRAEAAKEFARKHYMNVVLDIDVILRAIK